MGGRKASTDANTRWREGRGGGRERGAEDVCVRVSVLQRSLPSPNSRLRSNIFNESAAL